MKPSHIAIISFIAGAIVAGASVYILKPQRAAFSERDVQFLNQKITESSFPELRTAKLQALQAMELFENRKDEEKIALYCSRALANYLSASQRTLDKGDMAFMAADIQKDRDSVVSFLAAHPQLKP